ncbi:MAG TPA: tetratricopeptide repeat protein [Intrasporangium sp.]|uniref:tetratricopeptide repeat protein n=1 Tax=Intrasporangium sp. TaxID=1925024 RepID=UPI002D78C3CE|nr:tetratricopeptide repeat protein [Intrasporangium sp.]HET7399200.1 tetratricopeptide repeat protein [Intrasporangium sp.]
MTQQPFTAAALRGAVDLSSLKRPAPTAGPAAGPTAGGAPGAAAADAGGPGASGVVAEGTDASLRDVVGASTRYPVVLVLWSSRLAQSADLVRTFTAVAERYAGRFQLVTIDVDRNPAVLQAFQVQAVPVCFALVQGQPVPLFEGVQPEAQVTAIVDQVLALAAQHGVTGRVPGAGADTAADADGDDAAEPPLPPLHQKAFEAIEADDLETAAAAYREALAHNPADAEARLGLAQVGLLQRTKGVDPQAARAAAAAAPDDVDAQILVADLDLLGGHIEDAFRRLIDTVRVTADADRNAVREHLVELFDVVGPTDERVVRARKSLMSALF